MDRKPKLPDHESAAQLRPQPDALDQMFAECARELDQQIGKELDASSIDEVLHESRLRANTEEERSVPAGRAAVARPGVALYVLPDPEQEPEPEQEPMPRAAPEPDLYSVSVAPHDDDFLEVYTRIDRGPNEPDFDPNSDPMVWDMRACEVPEPDADEDTPAPDGSTGKGGVTRLWRWLFDRQGPRSGRS